MNVKIIFALLAGFFGVWGRAFGQELNVRVEVNYKQIKSKIQYDTKIYEEIRSKIQDFMNNTRWTNDIYNPNERINCNLIINLMQSESQNVFGGNARFQVIRPVYGSDYNSISFQFIDQNFNFSFQPIESQMVFNERGFSSNITSLAAYYSLLALVVDYDSFSKLGGAPYLQRLYDVVNQVLNSSMGKTLGWVQDDKSQRNRYWLVENIQNQQFIRLREELYKYHRLMLDDFGRNTQKGRTEALNFLEVIQNISLLRQNSILISSLMDGKVQEMVDIFSGGSDDEKNRAFLILSTLNPDKTEQYRKIIKG